MTPENGYSGTTNFINYAGDGILSSLAGQTVDLVFWVQTDSTYGIDTAFYITDVSLVVGTTTDIPSNDNFANAALLSPEGATNSIKNTYASRESGEPAITGNPGGHSLWYTWTPTAIGQANITVTDNNFTTMVAVYTGSSLGTLTKVASYDGINNSEGVSTVSFNPSPGTNYFITVDGYGGQSGTAELVVKFVKDKTPPTVSITSPSNGADVSGSIITIKGTAHDNVQVASVYYQLKNSETNTAWILATSGISNSWTNWTATITNLVAGTNTIRAEAYDTSGNLSSIGSHLVNYIIKAPISILTNGSGKVTGATNTELLDVTYAYTLTAKASSGYVFSNWTTAGGTPITTSPTLKFTMASNLAYVANFVVNPYVIPGGTYNGLFFDETNLSPESSGFFSSQVASNGHFTAKFVQGAKTYSVSGAFSLTGGWATNSPRFWEGTPLSLQLDLTSGSAITGYVGDSALTAYREVYSKKNPAPETGKYTIVVPPPDITIVATNPPGGNAFGTVTVSSLGVATFAGTLGDGTKVTESATLSSDGLWPLYIPTSGGKGMLLGMLSFTNETDRDIDGFLEWFKPEQVSAATYPAGFTNEMRAMGSIYSYTKGTPILDFTDGLLTVDGEATNSFTLSPKSIATGADKLHLTFSTSSGLFQGTTTNTERKTISFAGAILQKQEYGYGQVVTGKTTEAVRVSPQ